MDTNTLNLIQGRVSVLRSRREILLAFWFEVGRDSLRREYPSLSSSISPKFSVSSEDGFGWVRVVRDEYHWGMIRYARKNGKHEHVA